MNGTLVTIISECKYTESGIIWLMNDVFSPTPFLIYRPQILESRVSGIFLDNILSNIIKNFMSKGINVELVPIEPCNKLEKIRKKISNRFMKKNKMTNKIFDKLSQLSIQKRVVLGQLISGTPPNQISKNIKSSLIDVCTMKFEILETLEISRPEEVLKLFDKLIIYIVKN